MAVAGAVIAVLFSTSAAQAQGVDTTCPFALTRLDSSITNTLAVDTNAVYWGVHYTAVPGTRIRIEADFPYARYTSWNLYDSQAKPISGLNDQELEADAGSTNPFLAGADRTSERRHYTAFVEFGKAPARPKPNTIYSGDSPQGTLLLRVYMPDRGRDAKGGVPLPRLSVEPANGSGGAVTPTACREAQAPYPQQLNQAVAGAPGLPDPTDDGDGYPGRNPPNWRLYVNLARTVTDVMLDNETGQDLHGPVTEAMPVAPGIFANRDIDYVFAPTSRGFGEVLVVKGRAPTFPDTRGGAKVFPGGVQTRYFSFCQYEPGSQRVIGCHPDDEIPVDADGNYTVVVSTSEHRPSNARPECGVAWIPWGPATHAILVYRQMLAAASFTEATANIAEPGKELETMGPYYPSARYLKDETAFEARGCPTG
ncbi:MAG TPA: hypothetical protein VGF21_11790 [Thermoleophilaceae bacterium]